MRAAIHRGVPPTNSDRAATVRRSRGECHKSPSRRHQTIVQPSDRFRAAHSAVQAEEDPQDDGSQDAKRHERHNGYDGPPEARWSHAIPLYGPQLIIGRNRSRRWAPIHSAVRSWHNRRVMVGFPLVRGSGGCRRRSTPLASVPPSTIAIPTLSRRFATTIQEDASRDPTEGRHSARWAKDQDVAEALAPSWVRIFLPETTWPSMSRWRANVLDSRMRMMRTLSGRNSATTQRIPQP
jgi:hypothetical protein